MAIGGAEGIGVGPVQLELTIGILVISLIRAPAELLHAGEQFGDQRITAHQGQLVVAGLLLGVGRIGDGAAIPQQQEELRLHTAAQLIAQLGGPLLLAAQQTPRALLHRLAVEGEFGGHPAHLRLPGQAHQAARIGDRHHIAIGGAQIQPGGEPGEAGTVGGHGGDGRGGHELGPLHAEQVGEGNEQEAQVLFAGQAGEVGHGVRAGARVAVERCWGAVQESGIGACQPLSS